MSFSLPKAILSCSVLKSAIENFPEISRHSPIREYLPLNLHSNRKKLRQKIQKMLEKISDSAKEIYLGYGLCGNALHAIHSGTVSLHIIPAHDCITFYLGARHKYSAAQQEHPDAYWHAPGLIRGNEAKLPGEIHDFHRKKQLRSRYDQENAEQLFEFEQSWRKNDRTAIYIALFDNLAPCENCRQFAKKWAHWLGWNFVELRGDSRLIRQRLFSDKESEDLLIVPPEHVILNSNAESIVKAAPYSK